MLSLGLGASFSGIGWWALHRSAAPIDHGTALLSGGATLLLFPLGPLLLCREAAVFKSLPLALAVARTGCLAAGCCQGLASVPTRELEIAGFIVLHVLLRDVGDRLVIPVFLMGFGLIRLAIEPWRVSSLQGDLLFPASAIAAIWFAAGIFTWLLGFRQPTPVVAVTQPGRSMRASRVATHAFRSLAVSLLALTLGCASDTPAPALACGPTGTGVPLAYELRAPNGARAFLQGSVHVARGAEATLDPRAMRALREADVLVGELDMGELSQAEMAELTFEMGRLDPGVRLQDMISPDTWSLLVERSKQEAIPIARFEPFEPWVVALSFIGLSLTRAGFEPSQGVELQVFGGERPDETRGLETITDQLLLFADLPPVAQEGMLRDALRSSTETTTQLEALFAAWRCGDTGALEQLLAEITSQDPSLTPFYDATVFQRNLSMADGVDEVLAEFEHAFIVVGALHLVGPRGIPALLEQAGYRVEQATGR